MSRVARGCNLLSEQEAAYLAGLIDAGGLIGLYRSTGNAYVTLIVSSRSQAATGFCASVTGIGSMTKTNPTYGRPIYRWSVTAESAVAVLLQVLPFLVVQVAVASHVIDFQAALNEHVNLRKQADCHPDKPAKSRGLCRSCYYLAEKAGTIRKLPPRAPEDRRWQERWITRLAELRSG